ncbi:MAG: hypothetical protein IPL97_13845 [Niastella sp.]|nr:hypothetical protein [Niastella sp.]
MEQNPGAGWGISNFLHAVDESVLPLYLDKKEAYEFHYFKQPIFFASPGLAIISKKTFEAVGGFAEKRMVTDFEMWHKLSNHSPMALMPGNMQGRKYRINNNLWWNMKKSNSGFCLIIIVHSLTNK